MRIRSTAVLLASGLVLTLGPALAVPMSAGAAEKPGRSAEAVAAARAALAEIEEVVAGEDDGAGRRDLTLAMRDLFVTKHVLRGNERAAAERVLLRPTTPPDDPSDPRDIYYGEDVDLQTQCGDTFCLHWVEEGEHAAAPEFAATAFETIDHVAGVYAAAGFRAPLPDEGQEGDTRTDFYLGDLDQYGALGFCRSDASGPVVGSAWYGYCGFDNDYANSPWLDPTSLLQVTVAHEYFHAVQFAYDAEDDGWLMESTATAMEDELYDDVNDNAFFLNYGQMGDPETVGFPLAGPSTPLDTFDFTAYGNWGFWRYLTEQYPDETAGVPHLLREVWEALDTTQGPNPAYSLEALDRVLGARGTSTPDAYVAFAAANQHPADVYEEAVEQFYPTAPNTLETVQLSRTAPTASRTALLDHLTSATGAVSPFPGSRDLRVRVDLGDADVARAAITVHRVDGTASTSYVSVNRQGRGGLTVPFAAKDVSSVEVTVANGSTEMVDCGSFSVFACGGIGADDDLVAHVRVQAVG
jgi:hypothetical protein